jgi:hypothetical protein
LDEPIGICKVRVNFTARLLAHFRIPGYRQLKGNENSDKGIKKLIYIYYLMKLGTLMQQK